MIVWSDIVEFKKSLSQRNRPMSVTSNFYIKYTLSHPVDGLIFVEHLRMILLLHLNIRQQFAQIGILKNKYIRIVLAGYHLLGTDAICRKEAVILLILRVCHGVIRCLWLVRSTVTIVDIALWDLAF